MTILNITNMNTTKRLVGFGNILETNDNGTKYVDIVEF